MELWSVLYDDNSMIGIMMSCNPWIFLRLHWSLRMLHPTSFCSLGPYLGHPTTTLWTQGLGIARKTFQRRRTRDERTIDFHVVTYFMGCAGCPLVMTIIHYIVSIRFNSFLCLRCVPDSSYLVTTCPIPIDSCCQNFGRNGMLLKFWRHFPEHAAFSKTRRNW